MWRNSVRGYRDMYHAVSADEGQTFSEAKKLGLDTWKLDACPMDGGALAAADPAKLVTIWRRNKQIFQTQADQVGEQLLGSGEQPWATASREGVYLAWLSKRQGELWLKSPQTPKPKKLAMQASDPMLTSPVSGVGPVVLVWENGTGENNALMAQVISP
jgi:hypothetical protein